MASKKKYYIFTTYNIGKDNENHLFSKERIKEGIFSQFISKKIWEHELSNEKKIEILKELLPSDDKKKFIINNFHDDENKTLEKLKENDKGEVNITINKLIKFKPKEESVILKKLDKDKTHIWNIEKTSIWGYKTRSKYIPGLFDDIWKTIKEIKEIKDETDIGKITFIIHNKDLKNNPNDSGDEEMNKNNIIKQFEKEENLIKLEDILEAFRFSHTKNYFIWFIENAGIYKILDLEDQLKERLVVYKGVKKLYSLKEKIVKMRILEEDFNIEENIKEIQINEKYTNSIKGIKLSMELEEIDHIFDKELDNILS